MCEVCGAEQATIDIGPRWTFHSSTLVESYDEFKGWQNWSVVAGHHFEIRFSDTAPGDEG